MGWGLGVDLPKLEIQGSHTALHPHSKWRKVHRKCLEETAKEIQEKRD